MARLKDWSPCANRGTKSGAVKVATKAAPLLEPTNGTNNMIVPSYSVARQLARRAVTRKNATTWARAMRLLRREVTA